MKSGERMVWAAMFADHWRHEAEVTRARRTAEERLHWEPVEVARRSALAATQAVEAMRAAHKLGPVDIDGEAFAMLDDMLGVPR